MTAADRDRQVFKEVVRSEEHKEVLLGPSHPHTHIRDNPGGFTPGEAGCGESSRPPGSRREGTGPFR